MSQIPTSQRVLSTASAEPFKPVAMVTSGGKKPSHRPCFDPLLVSVTQLPTFGIVISCSGDFWTEVRSSGYNEEPLKMKQDAIDKTKFIYWKRTVALKASNAVFNSLHYRGHLENYNGPCCAWYISAASTVSWIALQSISIEHLLQLFSVSAKTAKMCHSFDRTRGSLLINDLLSVGSF